MGDIEIQIPKLREGSFFPSLLERRRRIDRALFAVVMDAWVHGVSTRKVDDLVKDLGINTGISKSEVSRICAELDRDLEAFRTRRLDGEFPYVFCDATYVKARVNGRVVSRAVVVATGVSASGEREVLGIDVGDSEDGAFWTAFLRSLRARGLTGVKLVISDHHLGLKAAIAAVFVGSSWQRCRVHFARKVLSLVPKGSAEMVAAAVRTIFAQPDAAHVRAQLAEVTRMLAPQFPTWPRCSRLPARTCWRSPRSLKLIGASCGAQIRARTPERRDQAADRRRGHLPERRLGPSPRHRSDRRDPRRVAGVRTALPV